MDTRIPVTVLTGLLGSGKSTLLNRMLTEQHGKRIAVIESEHGEIGIDHALVIGADEEVFEMNKGCVGCTVRGDLIRILGSLVRRRDKLDHVLVETNGLADPSPVAQTFFLDEDVRDKFRLDGIVTMIDAKHAGLHLDVSDECRRQVAFADVIVLNKTDLATADELGAVQKRIRAMNAMAALYPTTRANVPTRDVVEVGGFDPTRALETRPTILVPDDPFEGVQFHEAVSTVGLVEARPLDRARFDAWLSRLLRERGTDLCRMRGIVQLAGSDKRFAFQGVHRLVDAVEDRPFRETEPRRTEMIFIGKNLDREALCRGVLECVA